MKQTWHKFKNLQGSLLDVYLILISNQEGIKFSGNRVHRHVKQFTIFNVFHHDNAILLKMEKQLNQINI